MSEIETRSEKTYIRFSYADYESAIRARYYADQRTMSREIAVRFRDCGAVLDIASGQGLLLDALQDINVSAQGVDSEPSLVAECRLRGLQVTEESVFHFLATTDTQFDGAYCGHLIEHLAYEELLDLVEGIRRVLKPQGILLIRWPNPRSAITQHYTFWQDPTHVRFYDGDFIKTILEHYGFHLVEAHYNTVTPQKYADGDVNATRGTVPVAGGKNSLRRLGGNTLRGLKSLGRRFPAAQNMATFAESIYTRRQISTMNRLIFKLPVEAYIVARLAE